jgi:hypothetical protein
MLISCSNKHKNYTDYKDFDLVFRYLDDSLSGNISEEKYIFATFRVGYVCSNCRGDILFEELIDSSINRYGDIPLYIITDDYTFYGKNDQLSKLKIHYPSLKNVFYESPETLEKYGLYDNFPSMFLIENDDMIDARRLLKKKL